jgi:hypothetical protein
VSSSLRKNPLIWVALGVILGGTLFGLQGHFWVAIGADVAAVVLAVVARQMSRRKDRKG